MKKIFLLYIIIGSFKINSQTNVTGNIFSSTTWVKANSPYIIKNDITIYQGATLTIQSGVEVRVDNGFKINLNGDLNLNGLISDTILVHSSSPTPSKTSWYGIKFNGSGKVKMNFSVLKDSEFGLDYNNSSLPSTDTTKIFNSRFTSNNWGVTSFPLSRPTIFFNNCTFNMNISGMRYGEGENVYVKKCKFFNNNGGIGDTSAYVININIDSCDFYNNLCGASVNFYSAGSIKNSNFYNNTVRGIYLTIYGYNYPFLNNRIYNNKTGIYCFVNSPSMDSLNGSNSVSSPKNSTFYK